MQISFSISLFLCFVSVKPIIQPAGITLGLPGDRVELKCIVRAKPPPQVVFWKDMDGKEAVPLGNNFEMTTETNSDVKLTYKFESRIFN